MSPTHSREARQEDTGLRGRCLDIIKQERGGLVGAAKHYRASTGSTLKTALDAVRGFVAADLTLARSFAGEDRDYCLQRSLDAKDGRRNG